MSNDVTAGPIRACRSGSGGLEIVGLHLPIYIDKPDVDDLFDVFRQAMASDVGDPENSTFRLVRNAAGALVLCERARGGDVRRRGGFVVIVRIDRQDVSDLFDVFRQLME